MMNIKPISTNFQQVIIIDTQVIVREDYYKFEGKSNIYCIIDDKIAWFADIPIVDDIYSGDIHIKDNKIIASSWKGFLVEIELSSGQIISNIFTK